jgi:hypothetical protein
VRRPLLFLLFFMPAFCLNAQQLNCAFKPPQVTIHFGRGNVRDVNTGAIAYSRVNSYCPVDGYFSYTPFTARCFSDDWHTIAEDHTPGDQDGNMLLVNASPRPGTFLSTTISSLKPATTYEFGVWLMNVCRITDKCPFPLLPNLTIRLQTAEGQVLAQFSTGNLQRVPAVAWTQHRAVFTTSAKGGNITLTMINNAPGGCGNDFALDDITFRECIKQTNLITRAAKPVAEKKPPVAVKAAPKAAPKRNVPKETPAESKVADVRKPAINTVLDRNAIAGQTRDFFPPPPSVLTKRDNALVKRIETEPGNIVISLYDNGEIDGDTVSIYHNNVLVKSRQRLSEKPVTFSIAVNESQPYHELIMVAENLGSIPPNTSVMVITAGTARHELFISSTEQKNAKVIIYYLVPPK